MSENTVTIAVSSYNQIKAENTKWQLFMDRLFEDAELRADYSGIDFDVRKVEDLIHLVYPDRYKKKLSAFLPRVFYCLKDGFDLFTHPD